MILSQTQLDELVYYLQGTCMSIDQALNQCFEIDYNDVENELDMCYAIDNAIFECRDCGWWCEVGDWVEVSDPGNGERCSSCGEYE